MQEEALNMMVVPMPVAGLPVVLTMDSGDLQTLELALRYSTVPGEPGNERVHELWSLIRNRMDYEGVPAVSPE